MNEFRNHGFVDYNLGGEMMVHSGLLRVVRGSLSGKKTWKLAK
jgi:hypothetical protein